MPGSCQFGDTNIRRSKPSGCRPCCRNLRPRRCWHCCLRRDWNLRCHSRHRCWRCCHPRCYPCLRHCFLFQAGQQDRHRWSHRRSRRVPGRDWSLRCRFRRRYCPCPFRFRFRDRHQGQDQDRGRHQGQGRHRDRDQDRGQDRGLGWVRDQDWGRDHHPGRTGLRQAHCLPRTERTGSCPQRHCRRSACNRPTASV